MKSTKRTPIVSLFVMVGIAYLSLGLPANSQASAQIDVMDSGAAPELKELMNTSYRGMEDPSEPIMLLNGKWQGEPYEQGSAERPKLDLIEQFRLTGDLDGDGTREAVVLLNYTPGGSGQFFYLAVVKRVNNGVQNIATILVGDRVQVRAGHIEKNRVFLDVVQAGPNDAACCPGELKSYVWFLSQPQALLTALNIKQKPGRLSLKVLGEYQWQLHSWHIDEPIAKNSGVILQYKDGKLAGSAGCNRYFANAKEGDMPGDLVIASVGSTRKMCPPTEMAIEARYLKQLDNVNKFGFLYGQLMLQYNDNGVSKVMLFDKL